MKLPLSLPFADDLHVHLRQGPMLDLVTPTVRAGGCARALVMPNTDPPIKSCNDAKAYREQLSKVAPDVEFLMTLYLGPWTDHNDIATNAKACGVQGVKVYPRGVTTNSAEGVESMLPFYPVFECLQEMGLSLHLHGEVPGSHPLQAEADFLSTLRQLSNQFPKLRIVLEHVTTAAAIECVKSLPNVGATVTAHHIELTFAEVMSEEAATAVHKDFAALTVSTPHNFCKPIPKTPEDREAIRKVLIEGHPRFFLGSDSAPHPLASKEAPGGRSPPAGVFTSPYLMTYLADSFLRLNCLAQLEGFACSRGAAFLGLPMKAAQERIILTETPFQVPAIPLGSEALQVVPFRAGKVLSVSVAAHS